MGTNHSFLIGFLIFSALGNPVLAQLSTTEKADIGFTTLIRLEAAEGVPASHVKTLDAIIKALEHGGLEFIGTPEDGAGVRFKSRI